MSEESKPEKVPFNIKDLEGMKGKELLLSSFNKPDFPVTGCISEIISFHPYGGKFYQLGYLDKITYEDGSIITAKKPTENYLFLFEDLELPENQPPILKGKVTKSEKSELPATITLDKQVVLYLSETPTQKEKVELTCLFEN